MNVFQPALISFLVTVCLYICFSGFGHLAQRVFVPTAKSVDAGMLAGWGLSLVLVMAGPLMFLKVAHAESVLGIVALGVVLFFWFQFQTVRRILSHPARIHAAGYLAVTAALVLFSIRSAFPNPISTSDDYIAYATFPKIILDSGGLIQPFCHRRIVTLGGQSFLHAMILSLSSLRYLVSLEFSLVPLLLLLNLYPIFRKQFRLSREVCFFLAFAPLCLPLPRSNLSPILLFPLFGILIARTLFWLNRRNNRSLGASLLIATCLAASITIRANFIGFTLPLTLIWLLFPLVPVSTVETSHFFQRIPWIVLVATLVFVAPWSAHLYESSQTFFFPLQQGNYNPSIHMAPFGSTEKFIGAVWQHVEYQGLNWIIPLAMIIPLFCRSLPRWPFVFCLLSIVSNLFTIVSFPLSEPWDMLRYCAPTTWVGILICSAMMLGLIPSRFGFSAKASRQGQVWPAVISSNILCVLMLSSPFQPWIKTLNASDPFQRDAWANRPLYDSLINKIPKGSRVALAIDFPFILNFRSRDFILLDDIAVVSPGHGLQPAQMTRDQMVDYLRDQNIDYLIVNRNYRLYNDLVWLLANKSQYDIWQYRRPNNKAFFDNLSALASEHPGSLRLRNHVVINLRRGLRSFPAEYPISGASNAKSSVCAKTSTPFSATFSRLN